MLFEMKSDPVPCREAPKVTEGSRCLQQLYRVPQWLPEDVLFYLRRRAEEKAVVTFTASTEEQPVVMISEKEEIRWYFYFQVAREISTIALKF